jgi:hypothetical protein
VTCPTKTIPCDGCDGTGLVPERPRDAYLLGVRIRTVRPLATEECPDCHGTCERTIEDCDACGDGCAVLEAEAAGACA